MLTVYTLGKFLISDGVVLLNEGNIHSNMISKLFTYMLLHRDKTLATEDISAALWGDDGTENPSNALKNLMYRLRKALNENFGENDYIITNRGSYKWNPAIKVVLDIEEFERLALQAKRENVYEEAIYTYEEAIALYKGDFMSKLLDMHWVITLNTYYHGLYLTCVKALCELYLKVERYSDLDRLCNDALKFEKGDEQLYCYQIEARMKSGQISLALSSYERAREIIEKELGIRKTVVLNKVYEELLLTSKGSAKYNMIDVKRDISEEDPSGVFLCGYPIFKEIYRLEVRKNERRKEPENLLLLTVEFFQRLDRKPATQKQIDDTIKETMDIMADVLKRCLRVGDVASKYSDSQYIILLPTCTKELAMLVANRIISMVYDDCEDESCIRIRMSVEEAQYGKNIVG